MRAFTIVTIATHDMTFKQCKLPLTRHSNSVNYRSSLSLCIQLVVSLQTGKVLSLNVINHFVLGQIDTIVEVTAPEQIVVVPHLTALPTTGNNISAG